jgi:release factor glutamine methyltransferase
MDGDLDELIGALTAEHQAEQLAALAEDARLLVQHVTGCTHVDLLVRPTQALSTDQWARLGALVKRRSDGEPLAYLVNSAEFYSLDFQVTPAVLIPRPETELLVELAIERLQPLKAPRIVDLGTGCGVLAVTLKSLYPAAIVSAVDLSPAALEVARINAARHAVEVSFLAGDWYTPSRWNAFRPDRCQPTLC